ncbi:hypothetical protein HanXRQr2_Chr02g0059101 [Helianthus annuus]|uniref:Uncharacterized protein n=1 Tax=Helianthus annuus TaxID=4232 RepID=A0A251SPR4_HELAN|nr:hypothetical protein HanXRQr2_Chr02g0059101 [Helianthus annuus]
MKTMMIYNDENGGGEVSRRLFSDDDVDNEEDSGGFQVSVRFKNSGPILADDRLSSGLSIVCFVEQDNFG